VTYKSLRSELLKRPGVQQGYDSQRERNRLGQLLQRSRQSANLKQQELAVAAGITQADISRLETGMGDRGPTFETLLRLAHAQRMKLVVELVPENEPVAANEPHRLREAF
jgi:transcriptional regulator with XRE-family HTH domain